MIVSKKNQNVNKQPIEDLSVYYEGDDPCWDIRIEHYHEVLEILSEMNEMEEAGNYELI